VRRRLHRRVHRPAQLRRVRNHQVGNGSADELISTPQAVSAVAGSIVGLSSTGAHACAENESGELWCWGINDHGQLGRATPSSSSTPLLNEHITAPADVAAGFSFTCVIEGTRTKCWGRNDDGQLGNGTFDPSATPVIVLAPGSSSSMDFADVDSGDHHACGLETSPGQLYCWGNGSDGLLGIGTTGGRNEPQLLTGMDDIAQVETGRGHNCARRTSGQTLCWGNAEFGQVGDGSDAGTGVTQRDTPVDVTGLSDASDVAAGAFHSCAIRDGGQVVCWGKNDLGQLGNGTTSNSNVPVAVPGLDDAVQISVGQGDHSCALRSAGTLVCWGSNQRGQLGNGASGAGEHSETPVEITLPDVP